ncbi:RNA ligase RtcB family protein [Pacificoceanicola onchidii]|uniref:RNA ligase RtcB family protein n=1 Tax=Pacificoceanicola onchidii TaxID=2562685 RepID=UPI0010A2AFBC|nr:RNA ligase RtcB family protein [Pacificoceanicola onchidii]
MGNSHQGGVAHAATVSKFYSQTAWIEGRAEDQLTHVSNWPGMKHIAAFPDLHPGRHGPVGAAFLADRLYPQLIGPDIGCGMALFALDLSPRRLKLDKAARRLRVLQEPLPEDLVQDALVANGLARPDGLGTIGGGNHFCEVLEVTASEAGSPIAKGALCLLVHTGSRGHGARVYNAVDEPWKEGFDPGSAAALDYRELHDAAQHWANVNRLLIAERAAEALSSDAALICDAPHNHLEEVDGLWLHRKGAAAPDHGLAPLAGSREAPSFLLKVRETATPDALWSVSHGAGRKYDRASMHGRIKLNRSGLAAMERTAQGGRVICENRDLMIEEAGAAYKDVTSVAADLEDAGLAARIATLKPRITFKCTRKEGQS